MENDRTASLPRSMLFAAMAGGMGWGIRGQYGHETGAMIAGVLVGWLLVLIFFRHTTSLAGARAAALLTLGISLGGSMTYGQTIGLTHDAELIGNWQALGWGLLGLFIKGGIWIALAAAFLGIGVSGKPYRAIDLSLLLVSMCFLWFLGVHLMNQPYEPASRVLPRIYFSDAWRWEPDGNLVPRREVWGGLLLALIGMVVYARVIKRDRLVLRLAAWGFLAGGLGFALGQCVQAGHAWNVEWFRTTAYVRDLDPFMNWWNMMETTFGMVFGAVLAMGVWLNRDLIDLPTPDDQAKHNQAKHDQAKHDQAKHDQATGGQRVSPESELAPSTEWLLVAIHVSAVVAWSFLHDAAYDRFADQAITMILIPVLALTAGRWWPYLVTLPIVVVPIAGKTVRELVYGASDVYPSISPWIGWSAYGVLPVVVTLLTAWYLARRQDRQTAGRTAAIALLVNTWTYFALNLAFFRYPWPWHDWTTRTPHAMIFFGCAVGLTVAVVIYGRPDRES